MWQLYLSNHFSKHPRLAQICHRFAVMHHLFPPGNNHRVNRVAKKDAWLRYEELPLIDMWLRRGIRCVILCLIPEMAINKSFHRTLPVFVLRYARGLPALFKFAFSEIELLNLGTDSKCREKLGKKPATFAKARRCGLNQTIGVNRGINSPPRAVHCTQPYGPHGGAIKYTRPAS